MRNYSTMREARGALALDTGFDPFISGGWGRCTLKKLADAGYCVDSVAAAEDHERSRQAIAAQKEQEIQRDKESQSWNARPLQVGTKFIGGSGMSCVQIGDSLAHVVSDDGRACVLEKASGVWIPRLPLTGERIYR